MTWTRNIMVAFSIVGMLFASASFAQESKKPPVPRASIFIGSHVINSRGETLGKIEDLVLDSTTGSIKYAALSYGSILGFGGKLFAISWEALRLAPDGRTFVFDVSKELLERFRGFDQGDWPSQPDLTLSAAASESVKPSEKMAVTDARASNTEADRNAQGAVMSGTVTEVNAEEERLTLRMEGDKAVELQAPVEMLIELQTGDVVEVKVAGTWAIEIHKEQPESPLQSKYPE